MACVAFVFFGSFARCFNRWFCSDGLQKLGFVRQLGSVALALCMLMQVLLVHRFVRRFGTVVLFFAQKV